MPEYHFGVAEEASGVGKILEKDLIEPGQMRARLGVPFSLQQLLNDFTVLLIY